MIDLRSDTVTKPSVAMREAMMSAPVGDDVYGDDITVNSLEERIATLLGKEAGLFTPSGSLANQLAIRMLVKPGEELLSETNSHIVRAELGAAAVFSGITTRTWPEERGVLKAEHALEIARPNSGPYLVSTTAIAVENTHNFGGGSIQPITEIATLRTESQAMGIAMHLDGARLWNAHVATGIALADYAKYFDTVSVCLSKGLGAPVGSVMVGSKELVATARQWRKRYGGGMRQIGILAAAGHYALDNNIGRLADDHRRAALIAEAAHSVDPSFVHPQHVETNIVALDLRAIKATATEINSALRDEGVLASALGPKFLRFVTHLDINDSDIEATCAAVKKVLGNALVA
jgi:threonine aldolase